MTPDVLWITVSRLNVKTSLCTKFQSHLGILQFSLINWPSRHGCSYCLFLTLGMKDTGWIPNQYLLIISLLKCHFQFCYGLTHIPIWRPYVFENYSSEYSSKFVNGKNWKCQVLFNVLKQLAPCKLRVLNCTPGKATVWKLDRKELSCLDAFVGRQSQSQPMLPQEVEGDPVPLQQVWGHHQQQKTVPINTARSQIPLLDAFSQGEVKAFQSVDCQHVRTVEDIAWKLDSNHGLLLGCWNETESLTSSCGLDWHNSQQKCLLI